jgi:hypothetical protein
LAAAAAFATLAAGGCTMEKQEVPPLTGPSELALSLAVSATPDIITQDGSSQAVILVIARDAGAQPIANLPLRVDMTVNGVLTSDFGRLSAQTVTTGSDGRAVVVYTAPPPPPDLNDPEPLIRFFVTPIGSNFDNSNSRSVSILLVRPAIAQAPGAPFAEFTYSPANPRPGGQVQFNAQLSSDPGGVIVSYDWDYGDGDEESGITQSHDFMAAGDYQVTLTVTDNSGLKASKTRTITVQ